MPGFQHPRTGFTRNGRPGATGRLGSPLRYVVLLCGALLAHGGAAAVPETGNLYQARVIVTGQGEENRAKGLAEALRDVLAKVSGDPTLSEAAVGMQLAAAPDALVRAFRYRDRMEGIPVHDEQGTRDRPYDLTVDFHPEQVDDALRSIGREPWTGPRPEIVMLVGIKFGATDFILASEGDQGRDHREAVAAEAGRFGLPVSLPSAAALGKQGLTVQSLRSADPAHLHGVARAMGGDVALVGTLIWAPEALGWVSDWSLPTQGKTRRWQQRGGSFDQAFRTALGGAARILSGNGEPD